MRLYKKVGNTIQIISFPDEKVEKGSYLIIEDKKIGKSMIVQVIDIQFANVPGIMEELLREPLIDDPIRGEDIDPFGITSHILYVQDSRLLICKIHGTIEDVMDRLLEFYGKDLTFKVPQKIFCPCL